MRLSEELEFQDKTETFTDGYDVYQYDEKEVLGYVGHFSKDELKDRIDEIVDGFEGDNDYRIIRCKDNKVVVDTLSDVFSMIKK